MDARQFLRYIITPTLDTAGLNSNAAEVLLLGTALAESNLEFVYQKPSGPALGVYQCEPKTHSDIVRYIKRNQHLKQIVTASCYLEVLPDDPQMLIYNLRYATLIARIHYWRIPKKLPEDVQGLCEYYLQYYATPLSAATLEKALPHFKVAATIKGAA